MSPRPIYQPQNTMTLWWLGRPESPVKIGHISLVPSLRSVGLRYDKEWVVRGFPLSEDLPLKDVDFLPIAKDLAVGAVDDARPSG